jgi:hypothetical protein
MAMDRAGLLYRERLVKLILDHDSNAQLVRDELAAAQPRTMASAARLALDRPVASGESMI